MFVAFFESAAWTNPLTRSLRDGCECNENLARGLQIPPWAYPGRWSTDMKPMTRSFREKLLLTAALALAIFSLQGGDAQAAIRYVDDGAVQNSYGGFDLPAQGTCPAGAAEGYAGIDTRPECVALRLNYATQSSCTSAGGNYAWSTGVCNDLVNTTEGTCTPTPDRLWNAATNTCSIVMFYDDRNDVTCVLHGGTWVTTGACIGAWIMPARTAYTPALLTGNGTGDQCLRCHNSRTQYNNPRVRDTEDTMFMGHKNMVRKVTPTLGWGGPPFECTNIAFTTEEACYDNGGNWVPTEFYPSDDAGNVFDWNTGKITTATGTWDVTWIYGDWLGPLPRAIYKTSASTSKTCSDPRYTTSNCTSSGGTLINNAGASYSCGRCHATGWTSDATIAAAQTDARITKEPERSFPNITWTRTADAPANVVNMSGGVSGDPNRYSSWDVWGISCSRCHNSTIDTTTGSTATPPQYSSPTGMSSHHSSMTAADNNSGTCSDTRWTALTQCTASGGQWLTACSVNPTPGACVASAATSAACGTVSGGTWMALPGWCSNAFYTDETNCIANGPCNNAAYSTAATCTTNGGTWTPLVWQAGFCKGADPTGTTCGSGFTYRANGTQQSCMLAGATWNYSKCSIAGVCNKGAAYADAASCEAAGGQWRFATDIIRCDDAGGRWTGNNLYRGQTITRLCMDCHRQETGGLPYGATSSDGVNINYSATNPAGEVKVGQYHSTLTFLSHPHGNQYLNSPHAKFNGRFDQIATGKFKYDMTGEYKSYFLTDAEAANTGNGCTGCHEVHTSTVAGEEPFREECTECHAGPYNKDLRLMRHPSGEGTPIVDFDQPDDACEKCHMPEGLHLWRINTNGLYSTFPAGTLTDTAAFNANTEPEGTYANAVWVDVDHACGQCHGGGTAHVETTGGITIYSSSSTCTSAGGTWASNACSLSKVVTVTDRTGFKVGERITVADAGGFEYDELGVVPGAFESYITALGPGANQFTVVGAPSFSVTDKEVKQNPHTPEALWRSRADLAGYAATIHGDRPTAGSNVSFGLQYGTIADPTDRLSVRVDASASYCRGDAANCDSYDWDWGDGTAHGSGVTATHTYAAAGTRTITLAVKQYGVFGAAASQEVTLTAPDPRPTAAGVCSYNADRWEFSIQDGSSGGIGGVTEVVVNWGDGSVLSRGVASDLFSHTFVRTGTFSPVLTAFDDAGQMSTYTCTPPAIVAYFQIAGTVKNTGGTAGIPSARIEVRRRIGGSLAKTAYTAADGTFSIGTLKPGTYDLYITKTGYSFASPAASYTVGPTTSGNEIRSTNSMERDGEVNRLTPRKPQRFSARP